MFASLLPGLRDLRTPLAVGLLWIANLWAWFGHLVPDASDASGLIGQLYRLNGVFGTAVLITILSFAGYVLGLLVSSLHLDWRPVRYILPRFMQPLSWQSGTVMDRRYREAIRRAEIAGVEQGQMDQFLTGAIGSDGRTRNVEADIRLIAMRLQGSQKDIYDDYDRFRSEAEFRRSIALPLSALIVSIVLNLDGMPYWLPRLAWPAAVLLLVALHLLSWRKLREGNDLIIQSLLSGQVESPTIEALDGAAAEAMALKSSR
jgi:hypothetical protein